MAVVTGRSPSEVVLEYFPTRCVPPTPDALATGETAQQARQAGRCHGFLNSQFITVLFFFAADDAGAAPPLEFFNRFHHIRLLFVVEGAPQGEQLLFFFIQSHIRPTRPPVLA